MAARSSGGSRSEIGCGTAPRAQAANMLSTNPIELGSPIVTVEPSVTPRLGEQRGEPLDPVGELGPGQRLVQVGQRRPVRFGRGQLAQNGKKGSPLHVPKVHRTGPAAQDPIPGYAVRARAA